MVDPVSFWAIFAMGVFFDGLLYAASDNAGAFRVVIAGILWVGVAWICAWVAGMLPPLGVQLVTVAAPGVGRFIVPVILKGEAIRDGRNIASKYEQGV